MAQWLRTLTALAEDPQWWVGCPFTEDLMPSDHQ